MSPRCRLNSKRRVPNKHGLGVKHQSGNPGALMVHRWYTHLLSWNQPLAYRRQGQTVANVVSVVDYAPEGRSQLLGRCSGKTVGGESPPLRSPAAREQVSSRE